MNIGDLFTRALQHLRKQPFLILFGVLIAMLSGEGSSDTLLQPVVQLLPADALPLPESEPLLPPLLPELDPTAILRFLIEAGLPAVIGMLCGLGLIFIFLGVIVLVLHGGIITGVAHLEAGEETTFGRALGHSWRRAWHLLITASLPPIPITIAAILIILGLWILFTVTGGAEAIPQTIANPATVPAILIISTLILIPFTLMTLFLLLLWPLAERACILEERRAVDSFKRAWELVRGNAEPVVIMLLIQWALGTVLSTLLTLPRIFSFICCGAIPIIWLISGAERTYSSALWTVLWANLLREDIDELPG